MPWPNGYSYRRTVTVPYFKVPNTDQLNFPVLVIGTLPYLATVANGGRVQNASGFDVIFTSDANGSTLLNWEVVPGSYDPTTGKAEFWVQIPTASHTAENLFYLFYGNAGVSTDQSNGPATWDANYAAVYHLPNGVTLSGVDSTSNANTAVLGSPPPAATVGQIDGGAAFTSDDSMDAGANAATQGLATHAATWEAWVYIPSGGYGTLIQRTDASTGGWALSFVGANLALYFVLSGAAAEYDSPANSIPTNQWLHVAITYTGALGSGNVLMYINGVAVHATYFAGSGTAATDASFPLLFSNPSSGYLPLQGSADEVRISTSIRSADWIQTSYNNQIAPPSSFYFIGGEQTAVSLLALTGGSGTAIQVSTACSLRLAATGGTGPYTYGIAVGPLPVGLSLNASTGVISGYAAVAVGTYYYLAEVTDSTGATATVVGIITVVRSAPVFTGTPQWFQVPPYSSGTMLSQYAENQQDVAPGPFEWGGKCYWIVLERLASGSGPISIVAYQSNDYAQSQPLIRIPSSFSVATTIKLLSPSWDGVSNLVYFTWIDSTVVAPNQKHLYTASFDMSTGAFGSLNDPGVLIDFSSGAAHPSIERAYCMPLPGGNLILIWDSLVFATRQMSGILFNGSWGSVTALAAHTLLGAISLPGAKIGIWSTNPAPTSPSNLYYSTFDGATFTIQASLAVANYLVSNLSPPRPAAPLYDSVHDIAALAIMDQATTSINGDGIYQNIYSISPSDGSGGTIAVTAVDNDLSAGQVLQRELFLIVVDGSCTHFFALITQADNLLDPGHAKLFLYTASALTGPWSHQQVYYDQTAKNSLPPGLSQTDDLLAAFYPRVLLDGRLAVTVQFKASSSYRGLLAMIPVTGVVVSLARFGQRVYSTSTA